MKKLALCVLIVCVMVSALSVPVMAASNIQPRSKAQADDKDKIETVHGNALLGWTEIPKAVMATTKDTDNPFIGLTVGLLKGVANAFARTVSGVGDAVTLHNPEYKSEIKPSMVEIPCDDTKNK
jgi:putative exosortase-associated protein (TIGR04073 family)